jgi:ribulose-phosphate 3-epimerase
MLTADLLCLGEELRVLRDGGVDVVHVDVMDGVFCPQITVGPPFVKAIPDGFVTDVHLMIDEPLAKIQPFVEAGADAITFHVESTRHPHRVLQELAGSGVKRGVALNPGTPLGVVEPLLDELELVLVLAVNPGWSGQGFIAATGERLVAARQMLEGREILLAVDGGITAANVAGAAEHVDVVVTGSAIFDGGSAPENLRTMQLAAAGG